MTHTRLPVPRVRRGQCYFADWMGALAGIVTLEPPSSRRRIPPRPLASAGGRP